MVKEFLKENHVVKNNKELKENLKAETFGKSSEKAQSVFTQMKEDLSNLTPPSPKTPKE